jgi:hypothetical protein
VPDGELRRPPQLWEQRLARTTSVLAAGVSSGDATAIVSPTPPPGTDGGVEPAPVLPPPGDFIAPSQPTLIGSVQGINVVWNGLNSAGDLWPSDTSYVEVHMDTSGPTFTLGTATLKGRLARPGGLAVTGLSAGTTYYFRLRGADPAGNVTDASTAASGQPGLINAPDIAANAITANSIVAGTITGWSINSAYLSGGTVSGGYITGGQQFGASAQLLKSTSTVRLKDELTPLADDLAGVPADKLADFPASVDPYDVLTVTPTEFRSLSPADGDARSLGFIAEDVAAKLPWAANWDDDGLPSAVEDRPILAALLWVVRDQQATITDLRARIEALEA